MRVTIPLTFGGEKIFGDYRVYVGPIENTEYK